MSLAYVEAKIKEALTLSKGNKTKANQILIAMAQQDVKLLQGLTKHHLTGIAAYHVDRVISGKSGTPAANVSTEKKAVPKPKPVLKATPFGKEIMRAVSSQGGEVFGFDHGTAPKNKPASQSHVNAIKQMADRAKRK